MTAPRKAPRKRAPRTNPELAIRRAERAVKEAEEYGYVSPFPAPGDALVLGIDVRCRECGWTLYVSLYGEVRCINPACV